MAGLGASLLLWRSPTGRRGGGGGSGRPFLRRAGPSSPVRPCGLNPASRPRGPWPTSAAPGHQPLSTAMASRGAPVKLGPQRPFPHAPARLLPLPWPHRLMACKPTAWCAGCTAFRVRGAGLEPWPPTACPQAAAHFWNESGHYLFIQQTFTERLPRARHCVRHQNTATETKSATTLPLGLTF